MPTLNTLPMEMVATILDHLDSIKSLQSALLTCKRIRSSFYECQRGSPFTIIRRRIPQALLPYAIMAAKVEHLRDHLTVWTPYSLPPFPRPNPGPDIMECLEKLYTEPALLLPELLTMPMTKLLSMERAHSAIHGLTMKFATEAWNRVLKSNSNKEIHDPALSPVEYFRFCRAFYRAELFYRLFCNYGPDNPDDSGLVSLFFGKQPPWENEQIACAFDFLDQTFLKASRDVLEHDVGFGNSCADYLTPATLNMWTQRWLPRGVVFLHRLSSMGDSKSSYEIKRDMLMSSALDCSTTNLGHALIESPIPSFSEDAVLRDQEDEQLRRLAPRLDKDDTDEGPYEAWRTCNATMVRKRWVASPDSAGHRSRAYVLWDLERSERHHLSLERHGALPPEGPEDITMREKRKAMAFSWRERQAIARAGGSGYWSEEEGARRVVWWRGEY